MLLLVSLSTANGVRAADSAPSSSHTILARHELWLSLSATLLTAAITGTYGLKVAALNDRIDSLASGSSERPQLAQDAVQARRLAWGFGSAASLFAITSVLVILFQPGHSDDEPKPAPQLLPAFGAGTLGVHYARRF
jgi:hypothetical protein